VSPSFSSHTACMPSSPLSLEHEGGVSVPWWALRGEGGEGFASLMLLEQGEEATGGRQPKSQDFLFVCLFFKLMVFLLKQYIMFITPDLLLCFGFTFICVEMGPYPAKLCSIVQKQCLQTLTHAGSPVCPVHSPTGELQVLPGTVLIECMVQEPFSCGYVAFVQRSSHTCLYSNTVIEFCEAVCHCTSLPLTFVETASGNSCSFLQKRAEASRELRVVFSALSNGGRVLLLKM